MGGSRSFEIWPLGYSPDAALLECAAVGPHDPMVLWAGDGTGGSLMEFLLGLAIGAERTEAGLVYSPGDLFDRRKAILTLKMLWDIWKLISLICLKTRMTIHSLSAASLQCLW